MNVFNQNIDKMIAKFCLWTFQRHNLITSQIRIYVWSASAFVLFLSLIDKIHLQVALHILLFGSLGIAVIIWMLLSIRKALLLRINDPELKEVIYESMLIFIASRNKVSDKNNKKSQLLRI